MLDCGVNSGSANLQRQTDREGADRVEVVAELLFFAALTEPNVLGNGVVGRRRGV